MDKYIIYMTSGEGHGSKNDGFLDLKDKIMSHQSCSSRCLIAKPDRFNPKGVLKKGCHGCCFVKITVKRISRIPKDKRKDIDKYYREKF